MGKFWDNDIKLFKGLENLFTIGKTSRYQVSRNFNKLLEVRYIKYPRQLESTVLKWVN